MSAPRHIDIYQTILRKEQKDRLYFWMLSALCLITTGLVFIALT